MKRTCKEIQKNNWDFTLYDVDGKGVITVVFFQSMIDFSRSFYVTEEEKIFNFEQLKVLSEDIRNRYEAYKTREIQPAITQEEVLS
ncbi:MAG: hypothetical protein ACK4R6_05910 [Spirosomataceae bacterium]